jgi:hypothetical protein
MLTKVFDVGGDELGEIELSEKQAHVLAGGEDIVVIYHTPQTMRGLLGEQNGAFTLHKDGETVTAEDAAGVRRYASLQRAIKLARGP